MLCPRCYGKHVVVMNGSHIPCPECAGIGELHCCDGLREQRCPAEPDNSRFQVPGSRLKTEEPAARG